jgi:hypothetical protein
VQQMLVCTDGAAKGLLKILEERGETCQTWTQKP